MTPSRDLVEIEAYKAIWLVRYCVTAFLTYPYISSICAFWLTFNEAGCRSQGGMFIMGFPCVCRAVNEPQWNPWHHRSADWTPEGYSTNLIFSCVWQTFLELCESFISETIVKINNPHFLNALESFFPRTVHLYTLLCHSCRLRCSSCEGKFYVLVCLCTRVCCIIVSLYLE
jgi:hypothetical protein